MAAQLLPFFAGIVMPAEHDFVGALPLSSAYARSRRGSSVPAL